MARLAILLAAVGVISSAPLALAQQPTEYHCVLDNGRGTMPAGLRAAPGHISMNLGDGWQTNVCLEAATTCSMDEQGRIKSQGVGGPTSAAVTVIFDPAASTMSMAISGDRTPIVITGQCTKVN